MLKLVLALNRAHM